MIGTAVAQHPRWDRRRRPDDLPNPGQQTDKLDIKSQPQQIEILQYGLQPKSSKKGERHR
jgi:hypothetical protein